MSDRYNWAKEQALREEIVRVGRLMYERGLVVAGDGNISACLDEERVLCTPSGLCKGMMSPDQLIVVDMEANKVGPATEANRDLRPTSEVLMHLEVYRQRPDVGGVVHAHPPVTVALSIAGVSLADCMLPEVIVTLGLVPTTEYATPSSEENVRAIRNLIASHDGMILQRHGALTAGRDPWEAYMRLESIEQLAKITLVLHQLGQGDPLPPDQVEKLLTQRAKMGLTRGGEAEEFCEVCGVCHLDGHHVQPLPHSNSEDELVQMITQAVLRELGQSH
jgi:L-fuculose-phosphate aldolase